MSKNKTLNQAMILAAGLGSRLRPLTNKTPKALIKIKGVPILELIIKKLKDAGVSKIVINTHHLAQQISDFLISKKYFDLDISISYEPELLDSGGAIKKASNLLDNDMPFILHNVDILSDIDIASLYNFHTNNNSFATLAVSERPSSRVLLFNSNKTLCGWADRNLNKNIIIGNNFALNSRAFSGIHIISSSIFYKFPKEDKFSIIKLYLDLCSNQNIMAYNHSPKNWVDIGTPKALMDL